MAQKKVATLLRHLWQLGSLTMAAALRPIERGPVCKGEHESHV